jgi:hypothetical protein
VSTVVKTAYALATSAAVAATLWPFVAADRGPPPILVPHERFAGAPAAPPPADDPAAVALLGDLHRRILDRPFYAVGVLHTHRGGVDRELILRLYYRSRGVSLARIEGSPREDGTMVLRRDGRVVMFLPRADLVLDLPPSLGADRLFGSDFAVDDLLALGGGADAFAATLAADEDLGGVACRRVELRPRTPSSSPYGRVSIWVARDARTPTRMEFASDRGAVLRSVDLRGGDAGTLPVNWTARTLAPRPGTSELEFRFFERDPPVPDDFFTVEGMRRWR